jgi:hypothetical protein
VQDAADHAAVIYPIFAAHIRRQMWFDLPPLIVAQPKQIAPHRLCSESRKHRESATDSADNEFIEFSP